MKSKTKILLLTYLGFIFGLIIPAIALRGPILELLGIMNDAAQNNDPESAAGIGSIFSILAIIISINIGWVLVTILSPIASFAFLSLKFPKNSLAISLYMLLFLSATPVIFTSFAFLNGPVAIFVTIAWALTCPFIAMKVATKNKEIFEDKLKFK